jgi:hypothetical protein
MLLYALVLVVFTAAGMLSLCYCWDPKLPFYCWYSLFPPPHYPPDPWQTLEPLDWADWSQLPQPDYRPVAPGTEDRAIAALEESSFVELSAEELAVFAPGTEPRQDGTIAYLVRGVAAKRSDGKSMGSFVVYRKGVQLRVHHGSMGFRNWGYGKVPLVIWLPFKPTAVYVDLSAAV